MEAHQSNTLLSSLDRLPFTAHDNESTNYSDSGYFSFIHRYKADGVAKFAGRSAEARAPALGDDAAAANKLSSHDEATMREGEEGVKSSCG